VPEPSSPLVLLHEDHDLVAVAKPAGEPVIPARGEPARDCVQRRLERQLGRRLWVVHRIDRDASGVVLFALNADAHRELSLAFEHRQVAKTYAAFVAGSPEPPRGRLDVPLHSARKGKTRPARPGEPGGQAAETEYAVRKRWRLAESQSSRGAPFESGDEGYADVSAGIGRSLGTGSTGVPRDDRSLAGATVSLVEARPLTGRHHQIRVHLRSAGAPILFDPLYGRGLVPEALAGAPCGRLALHARRIDVPAPRGGGRVVVEAPLAPDLAALAEWLDAHGHGEAVGVPA
jgi:tRNA pseudouridine32 synthase / 23S rRNA pseudouridine746 synthase